MLSAEESAELRSLQARAYGPGGELSTAELERLQGLERLRLPTGAQPDSSRSARSTPRDGLPDGQDPRVDGQDGVGLHIDDQQVRDVEPAEGETTRGEGAERVGASNEAPSSNEPTDELAAAPVPDSARRRHPLLLVGAAGVALVLGVGIGWLVFGRDAGPAIPITAEQQIRGEELAEEANLDPGSLTPMAEAYDVLAWMGTRDEGDITCLIIDDGAEDFPSCAQTESVTNEGLFGVMSRNSAPESAEKGTEMINVSLGLGRTGEAVVMIHRGWAPSDTEYLTLLEPEQRVTAERLIEDGLDEWSLSLAAYDEDVPIWIGTREVGQQVCLYYGGDVDAPSSCEPMEVAQTTGAVLTILSRADDAPSGRTVTLRYSEQQLPSILISELPSSVPVPVPEPEIDDKTGDDETGDDKTGDEG